MKTPEEIEEFLELENLNLNEFETSQSTKSNLLIGSSNFRILNAYLANILSFVKNLYETFDPQNIILQVLSLLETTKTVLDISVNAVIGNSTTQTVGTKIYRISRVDDFKIVIEADNIQDWNTDTLIVQVKTVNGMIVYPTIITGNNAIEIYFNDTIGTNYKIYWL